MKLLIVFLLATSSAFAQTDSIRVTVNESVKVNHWAYRVNPARIYLKSGKTLEGYAIYTFRNKFRKAISKSNTLVWVLPYLNGYTDKKGNKISRALIETVIEPDEW